MQRIFSRDSGFSRVRIAWKRRDQKDPGDPNNQRQPIE